MYKDFSHIKNVSEDGTSATMLLNKRIGNLYNEDGTLAQVGIQGDQFANEMLYLKTQNVKIIEVEINSVGGDVIQGYDIINAIQKHKANTRCTGIAASMAFGCLIAGVKRSIVDYGSLMTHAVSGGTDENKVLGIFQDSLKTLYIANTKLKEDEADTLFKGENWFSNSKKADFTLQDALDKGIIDTVEVTGRKVKEITNAKKDMSALAHIYNSIITPKNENMIELKKVLNLKNDLSDEKTESVAIETIKDLQAANSANKTALDLSIAKVTELQTKVDGIENAAKVEKTKVATEAVELGIKNGRIKLENKADMIVLAETNLKAFNTLVGNMPDSTKAVAIFNAGKAVTVAPERAEWTLSDWIKNDAKGLDKTLKVNPNFIETLNK